MEGLKSFKTNLCFLSVLVILSSSILISHSLAPPGTIERTTKQQFLASLPPSEHDIGSSQLFLTSPSSKYVVYLLRRETSLGAGGFGNDFCYIQVQESGVSVWESECTPVSNVNTCTLLFSEAGLEIFDGSQSAWDSDVDGENLEALVLMDSGDMQIRDKDGELVWKASDNPIVNQNCGSIGAPGLAPDHPPFGSPIHDGTGPFGQPAGNLGQQPQPQLGTSQEHQQAQEEQQPLPEQPGASPEQEHQPLSEEPVASPEEEHQPLPEKPAASPDQVEPQQQQLQLEPAGSPEAEHGHHQQQQQQVGGFPDQSSLNHHLIGVRNQPYSSLNQQPIPIGVGNDQQPLIDNTPFDSGCSEENSFKFGLSLVFLVSSLMGFLL